MKLSFHEIEDFYNHSRGRMVRRLMRVLLKDWWPDLSGLHVMGIGYTHPYMGFFKKDEPLSETMLMNKRYHPKPWPTQTENILAVCDDLHLPVETQRMDRIFVMHGLETSDHPQELLEELWRVLDGNGRMIIIVPNRSGVWSRAENTPFGQGHPYSLTQLRQALTDTGFTIERYIRALYVPSGRSRILISLAPFIERLGRKLYPAFGGLLMVEVSKQLFSPITVTSENRVKSPKSILPSPVKNN